MPLRASEGSWETEGEAEKLRDGGDSAALAPIGPYGTIKPYGPFTEAFYRLQYRIAGRRLAGAL